MKVGIWILGDQLWEQQTALLSCAEKRHETPVILIESLAFAAARPYHQQKLVLVWSAMRHFAHELRQAGWLVTYIIDNDWESPLRHWVTQHHLTELRIVKPNDRPFHQTLESLNLPCAVNLLADNHFLWSETEFQAWAGKRKRLLLEDFYREGRKRFDILMVGDKPVGNQWNFDKHNRKPPKGKLHPPKPLWFEPDETTQAVIDQVQTLDLPTYGHLKPFRWATNRHQALQVLDDFITFRLSTFGPYQDAMVTSEDTLWHCLLSPYLNLGLLHPREVIQAAQNAHEVGNLDLASVEGFIRQILGWREYMRGVYLLMNDNDRECNWFEHDLPLPEFFWDAQKTSMNCVHQVLCQVERTGYAHHIQRLMVLSNFALIAGLSPQAVENWFHATFIDAYDWVMQTNVLGMGLFADGGVLASKPYAASANYINRMSDYCQSCAYHPGDRSGQKACPFNFLYWDFLDRHYERLQKQGRMNLMLAHLEKLDPVERNVIRQKAIEWRSRLRADAI